jgi:hypothetical protein
MKGRNFRAKPGQSPICKASIEEMCGVVFLARGFNCFAKLLQN